MNLDITSIPFLTWGIISKKNLKPEVGCSKKVSRYTPVIIHPEVPPWEGSTLRSFTMSPEQSNLTDGEEYSALGMLATP